MSGLGRVGKMFRIACCRFFFTNNTTHQRPFDVILSATKQSHQRTRKTKQTTACMIKRTRRDGRGDERKDRCKHRHKLTAYVHCFLKKVFAETTYLYISENKDTQFMECVDHGLFGCVFHVNVVSTSHRHSSHAALWVLRVLSFCSHRKLRYVLSTTALRLCLPATHDYRDWSRLEQGRRAPTQYGAQVNDAAGL